MKPAFRDTRVNLLVLTVAVALSAAGVEAGFRAYYRSRLTGPVVSRVRVSAIPGMGFEMIPDPTRGEYRVNRLGLWGDDVAVPKPPGVYRIAVLGDSQTAGFLPLHDSIPADLRDMLNADARLTRHRRFEVINAGVVCYNIRQVEAMLAHVVGWLAPDLVIYDFYGNDLDDDIFVPVSDGRGGTQIINAGTTEAWYGRTRLLPRPVEDALFTHLLSFRYALFVTDGLLHGRLQVPDWDLGPQARRNLGYIDRMVADTRRIGAGFMVATIGVSSNAVVCDPNEKNYLHSEITAAYAAARGVPVIQLNRAMCGMPAEGIATADGVHYASRGTAVMAEMMKDFVTAYLLPGEEVKPPRPASPCSGTPSSSSCSAQGGGGGADGERRPADAHPTQ